MGQSVFILTDEDAETIIRLLKKEREETQAFKEELKRRQKVAKSSEVIAESSSSIKTVTVPETGFIRLAQVLEVIPLGKSCWWAGVKSGRFPKPIKLSKRCTAWRAEDIHILIKELSDQNKGI